MRLFFCLWIFFKNKAHQYIIWGVIKTFWEWLKKLKNKQTKKKTWKNTYPDLYWLKLDPLVVHHWVIFSSVDGSGEVPLCAFVLVPPWCALNLLQCVTTATFQSDVYFWGIDEVIGRQIWWMRQVVSLDCVSVCVFSHAWWHADMNHSSSHLGHNRHFRMLQMKYMLTVSPRGTNSKCTFCECWKKIISMLLVSRLTRWWVWSLDSLTDNCWKRLYLTPRKIVIFPLCAKTGFPGCDLKVGAALKVAWKWTRWWP